MKYTLHQVLIEMGVEETRQFRGEALVNFCYKGKYLGTVADMKKLYSHPDIHKQQYDSIKDGVEAVAFMRLMEIG